MYKTNWNTFESDVHKRLETSFEETCLSEGGRQAGVPVFVDGAGWHKSKELKIPENVQLVFLPPYCPELNPVERLWRYIKDHAIKNRVFETLQQLEDAVCEFVKQLSQEKTARICKT